MTIARRLLMATALVLGALFAIPAVAGAQTDPYVEGESDQGPEDENAEVLSEEATFTPTTQPPASTPAPGGGSNPETGSGEPAAEEVVAAAPTGAVAAENDLAFTGSDANQLAILGALLVFGGGAAVLLSRRGRTA